jgi:hypothetical protein
MGGAKDGHYRLSIGLFRAGLINPIQVNQPKPTENILFLMG